MLKIALLESAGGLLCSLAFGSVVFGTGGFVGFPFARQNRGALKKDSQSSTKSRKRIYIYIHNTYTYIYIYTYI